MKEHCKEVDSITKIFTRAEKTRAASICNKSAITEHVCNENHVIDWENAKVIDRLNSTQLNSSLISNFAAKVAE